MDTKDWVFLGIAVAQTLYAAATFHREKLAGRTSPLFVMFLFAAITWSAVGFNYYNRPHIPGAVLVNYGIDGPNQFHGIAQLTNWEKHKGKKAVLITRTVYGDRDRLNDEWIAKSTTYTIEGPIVAMVAVSQDQMRFTPGLLNMIEYNVAVIPADISTSQIRTLSDVTRLGGQILAISAQGIPIMQAEAKSPT